MNENILTSDSNVVLYYIGLSVCILILIYLLRKVYLMHSKTEVELLSKKTYKHIKYRLLELLVSIYGRIINDQYIEENIFDKDMIIYATYNLMSFSKVSSANFVTFKNSIQFPFLIVKSIEAGFISFILIDPEKMIDKEEILPIITSENLEKILKDIMLFNYTIYYRDIDKSKDTKIEFLSLGNSLSKVQSLSKRKKYLLSLIDILESKFCYLNYIRFICMDNLDKDIPTNNSSSTIGDDKSECRKPSNV